MTARMREVEVEEEQRPFLRFVCFFASQGLRVSFRPRNLSFNFHYGHSKDAQLVANQ